MAKDKKINFSCKHSKNLSKILKQLKSSIVVTTYQSKKLITISEYEDKIDARYVEFERPMGMYAKNNRLWAGFGHSIWEFANFNSAAEKIDSEKKFDACYLPLNIHFTGDIDVHEMEYCNNELYFINTKFSCLCKKGDIASFKPIWKPSFISLLQPLDKCHLNGLCSKDNEPRYVTALGQTDKPLGWRDNKVDGGVLIDIKTNEVLLEGLSMPHSPRWHKEKLWFLESGKGTLSFYNFKTKKAVEVAKLPGFTRGVQFVGDHAFIGLSKVRESATFSGLPITKLEKRISGVWLVNINTGDIVSFLEFDKGVEEIFSVSLIPARMPEFFSFSNSLSKANYIIEPDDLAEIKMPTEPVELAAPYFEKGNDLFNENKKEEAIVQFQKALSIEADYLPATFNIAIALGDLGRFKEAEEILFDVLEKDASLVEAYNSLGYLYYKQDKPRKSKEQFLKVLELDPEFKKAKSSLLILEKEAKERREINKKRKNEKV